MLNPRISRNSGTQYSRKGKNGDRPRFSFQRKRGLSPVSHAYVFARFHMRELHLEKKRLMQVEQVQLEVVGPREFFDHEKRSDLFSRMDKAVSKFAEEKTDGALSMLLRELSFPAEFDRIPFVDGRAMKEKCRNGTLSREGARVRDAFSRLVPVR